MKLLNFTLREMGRKNSELLQINKRNIIIFFYNYYYQQF
jgi:hypothetical protein